MRFKNKTVLIFGGNSGIGLASAKAFADEGARVIMTGRNADTIQTAVAAIKGASGHAVDISNQKTMTAFLEELAESGTRVDVLFVNAGIGTFASLEEITPELWDHVHEVNLKGCTFAALKALPVMRDGGNIIFTGSIGAHAALPGNTIYAAAKAGLSAVMKNMARELVNRNIRVNMISPGPTETPIITRNVGMDDAQIEGLRQAMIAAVPMKRMGEADEVARAVLFLASSEASFITGIEMFVDGGTLELR